MKLIYIILLALITGSQPVMDMAPRWKKGYGFQVIHKTKQSTEILKRLSSSETIKYYKKTFSFEGVYTWDKSIRITYKIPFHLIKKDLIYDSNNTISYSHNGIGNIIIALPLKKYTNHNNYTENIGITPQIKIGTGKESISLPSYNSLGIGIGYSRENSFFYQKYNITIDLSNDSKSNSKALLDAIKGEITFGIHPIHNNNRNFGLFCLLDINIEEKINIEKYIYTGPRLLLYKQNFMMSLGFKFPFTEKNNQKIIEEKNIIELGVGLVL